ncbi:hypothetical protein SLS62_000840 [Diatrype stigma]|uniref:Uncharacterized protein n=1 Tax=Diatrype stigma TaxID=117547 RepID=A0AAN9UXC3_9PEZI
MATVRSYKDTVPRFEELIQQRREAFQTADSIVPSKSGRASSQAANVAAEQAASDESRSVSPARPSALEGFAQRLLSELGSPSPSNSPRRPKEASRSSRSLSTPTKPLPQKPLPTPPKEFPLNLENPSQSKFIRPASEAGPRDESALPGRTSPFRAAATFAAEDQEILSRRVGLPTPAVQKVAPIPLDLKKAGGGGANVTEEGAGSIAEDTEDKETADDKKEQPGEEQVEGQQVGEQQVSEEQVSEEQVSEEQVSEEQVGEEQVGEEQVGEEQVGEEQPRGEVFEEGQQAKEEGSKEEEGEAAAGGAVEAETVETGDAEAGAVEGGAAESETPAGDAASGETAEVKVEAVESSETDVPDLSGTKTTSVSHLLTNAIIFQTFLFELASLVQVRAGLFNEVKFA